MIVQTPNATEKCVLCDEPIREGDGYSTCLGSRACSGCFRKVDRKQSTRHAKIHPGYKRWNRKWKSLAQWLNDPANAPIIARMGEVKELPPTDYSEWQFVDRIKPAKNPPTAPSRVASVDTTCPQCGGAKGEKYAVCVGCFLK